MDVLCTAQAFGVEVDEAASGEVREVRAAGQVNDVAHGVLLRLWSRPAPGGDAGRERAAAPPILPIGIGATAWPLGEVER